MTDEAAKTAHDERLSREREEKSRKAQLLRVEHHLKLLDLGVDEELALDYGPASITPRMRLVNVPKEQIELNRQTLLKLRQDITAMG